MLIRLDDNTLVDDLCAHYRRSGFRVEPMGGGMVDVARENAPTPEQERHEVLLHLRVWEAVNPDVIARARATTATPNCAIMRALRKGASCWTR